MNADERALVHRWQLRDDQYSKLAPLTDAGVQAVRMVRIREAQDIGSAELERDARLWHRPIVVGRYD